MRLLKKGSYTTGIGTTGIVELVMTTSGISNIWHRQHLAWATSDISNIWYRAKSGIGQQLK